MTLTRYKRPPASSESPYQIPDKPLPLAELRSLDADLRVSVAKLRTGIDTRVDDIEAEVRLSEGRLEVAPLSGGFAGGSTDLRLLLDASETPARFDVELRLRQMLLEFAPSPETQSLYPLLFLNLR